MKKARGPIWLASCGSRLATLLQHTWGVKRPKCRQRKQFCSPASTYAHVKHLTFMWCLTRIHTHLKRPSQSGMFFHVFTPVARGPALLFLHDSSWPTQDEPQRERSLLNACLVSRVARCWSAPLSPVESAIFADVTGQIFFKSHADRAHQNTGTNARLASPCRDIVRLSGWPWGIGHQIDLHEGLSWVVNAHKGDARPRRGSSTMDVSEVSKKAWSQASYLWRGRS